MRYAEWMLAHEAPFATRFDRVEYPTESWPAQDIRKSCVFDYAAQYGPAESRERDDRQGGVLLCAIAARRALVRDPRLHPPARRAARQWRAARPLSAPSAGPLRTRCRLGSTSARRATSARRRIASAPGWRRRRGGGAWRAPALRPAVLAPSGHGEDLVKVLLLVHGLDVGGAESMIAHLAHHLRASGDDVEIGCLGALGDDRRGAARRRASRSSCTRGGRASTRRCRGGWRHASGLGASTWCTRTSAPPSSTACSPACCMPCRSSYTEHGPRFGPDPSASQRLFNRLLGRRAGRITAVSHDAGARPGGGRGLRAVATSRSCPTASTSSAGRPPHAAVATSARARVAVCPARR